MTITTFIEQRLIPLTLAFAAGVAVTVSAIKADSEAGIAEYRTSRVTIECHSPGLAVSDNKPHHNEKKYPQP